MIRESHFNLLLILGLLLVPLAAWQLDEPFVITLTTKVLILSLAGVGLNIALGLGGMISLGHAAFFGLGGYVMGILASHAQSFTPILTDPFLIEGSKNMPLIWVLSMLFSALIALIIGVLSLRTNGAYFIMVTLAFAQMLYYLAVAWPTYGGEDGLPIYLRNEFPGLNTLDPIQFFALCFCLLVAALWFSHRIWHSPFGLSLASCRQNPHRVSATGIRPFNVQLTGFVLSAMITGLAGALFADLNRFVSPSMLHWQVSGEIIIFVILGGVGRVFGPVAGATLFILLEHFLGGISEFWKIWLGLILLLVVLFARGGIIGAITKPEHKRI